MTFDEFRKYRPKQPHNVYVLACEDDFLVEQSKEVWRALFGGSWTFEKMPVKEFEEIDSGRLMDLARTSSLFAESRALMVTHSEKLTKRRSEELAALDAVPDSSLKLVLVCTGLRGLESWMKPLPVVTLDPLKPAEVARWLIDRYKVSPEVARYVVESAGTDLWTLHHEMEKLRTFAGDGRAIGIRDVDICILRAERFGTFELDDAIMGRNYRKAAAVAGAMLDEGMEPLVLLARIIRVWRQIFIGKGVASSPNSRDAAAAAGIPAWKAGDFLENVRKFGWPQITAGFRELLQVDRALKSTSPAVVPLFDVMLWKLLGPVSGKPPARAASRSRPL